MKNFLPVLLFIEGLCFGVVFPGDNLEDPCFNSPLEFSEWVMHYYQNSAPKKLSCSLTYFSDSPIYENERGRMLFIHFYAALFSKDPHLMKQIYEMVTLSGNENARIIALHVFWLTDTEESHILLERAVEAWESPEIKRVNERMRKEKPRNVLTSPLNNIDILDNLWATFFATGDFRPVQRIASAAHLVETGHGLEILVGGAASWSLTANAREHPRVREILENMATRENGIKKQILEEILMKSKRTNSKDDT